MASSTRLLAPARQLRPASRVLGMRARTCRRFQSSDVGSHARTSGGSSGAVAGGLMGGAVAAMLGYGWYYFSGTKSIVNSAHQTKEYFDSAFRSSTAKAPAPDQAVQWLRETVTGYAKFVPGAQSYVDSAFDDIQKVQEKHGQEVDDIIRQAYDELRDATKTGANMAAVSQAWHVLQKCFKRISSLAGDAAGDILENHPQLKEMVGDRMQQLQKMGDQYGPEAKKQVDEAKKQVQEVIKGGLTQENMERVKKLVQEKSQQLKSMGDQAWEKGLEQAKPILDKQPELKQYVEKNKDKLLQGDLGTLWSKLQEAVKTGNVDDAKKFIEGQVEKSGKSMGGGFEQLFSMIPGGGEVSSKFQQLQELSQKHGKEAEKLIKSALQDVKGVLDKKVEEGKQLKEKAEKDSKS